MKITRITLKSFLVSLLGILTAEVGFSNGRQNGSYDVCYNVTAEEICYFYVSDGEPNWNTAHGKCQNKNSSLPIIRNRKEQTVIKAYLEQLKPKSLSISAVWTSGKKITYGNWTWINGQTLNTTINNSNGNSAMETHMMFDWRSTGTENILKPDNPVHNAWYLCQYKDHQCNGQQHEVNATNGCLIPSEYGNISWYEARNECLSKGGDLAILTDQDILNIKNHSFPRNNYWIGLRKVNWVWQTNSQALPEEVKYTKWVKETMRTEEDLCIFIAANNVQWRASFCSSNQAKTTVICEKRVPTTTDSTSRKSTAATTIGNSNTTIVTAATTMSQNSNVSSMIDKEMNDSTVLAAIGAGVVIIILSIIVILVVILCRKSKSSNNKTEPAVIDSETQDKKTKVNISTTTTEERSIYADIPLAERNANDAPEAGQKGTVYASLDFNQGVTYAEPSKLYAVTKNIQDVSGPIYAEPLNATGNGATSAGSSPAIKIGPMGDVYALPTTNVTPSSDKTTERPIYANT